MKTFCGPSPRVWGELLRLCSCGSFLRTIPTRVGRTVSPFTPRPRMADHPHACGENGSAFFWLVFRPGPSPRVWGELIVTDGVLTQSRTIPTRVGRTAIFAARPRPEADHPHACGENGCFDCFGCFDCGPSPRVWGERLLRVLRVLRVRTIPTRVGRTWR